MRIESMADTRAGVITMMQCNNFLNLLGLVTASTRHRIYTYDNNVTLGEMFIGTKGQEFEISKQTKLFKLR